MARKDDSRSNGRSASMKRLRKAARDNMTTPNLLAAGAVALGAAAFAYLRDEQRRSGLMDTARRGRDTITHRWQEYRGSAEQSQPTPMGRPGRRSRMKTSQAVPALP